MLSLRGNVYAPEISQNTQVLKQAISGGNLPAQAKKKAQQLVKSIEKAEKKKKLPALDLRAMYGND